LSSLLHDANIIAAKIINTFFIFLLSLIDFPFAKLRLSEHNTKGKILFSLLLSSESNLGEANVTKKPNEIQRELAAHVCQFPSYLQKLKINKLIN
jgi:hypothetical protein